MPTQLLIADDHILFNEGLKSLIQAENDLQVCGQVYCGSEVLPFLQTHAVDLVLLDINLPNISGIALVDNIKQTKAHVKILMISMYTDKHFVDACMEKDVPGYILKNASKSELLEAIRTLVAGGRYYDQKLTKPSQHSGDSFARKYALTRRELEILYLIKEKHTNQQIADQLFLSVFTVETHRRNINLKLGIKNPADLIHFIYKNHI